MVRAAHRWRGEKVHRALIVASWQSPRFPSALPTSLTPQSGFCDALCVAAVISWWITVSVEVCFRPLPHLFVCQLFPTFPKITAWNKGSAFVESGNNEAHPAWECDHSAASLKHLSWSFFCGGFDRWNMLMDTFWWCFTELSNELKKNQSINQL